MGGKALNGKQITNEEALQLFEKLVLENNLGCKTEKILLCGSARRGKDTCGDLDIVFIDGGEEENLLKEWLIDNYGVKKNGKPQTTILYEGVQVDFYEATHETWGSNVLMWTGSAFNNVRMRRKAKKLGYTMSQHGILNEGVNLTSGFTEEQIYAFLGYDYVEPQKR
jgi:DNA polymerase (family 10)